MEEGSFYIKERGKWYGGKHFPLQSNNGMGPFNDSYKKLLQDIVDDVPFWIKLQLGVIKLISVFAGKEDEIFVLNDSGSSIYIPVSSIPPMLDTLACTSWSWYGSSPDATYSDLTKNEKIVIEKIKSIAVNSYGMEYGIGGFYQFEPFGTQLMDTCWLTIVYNQEDVVGMDESSLGMYCEDKDNRKWIHIGGIVDTIENTVTAPIMNLSLFTIAPRLPYGTFGLNVEPDSVYSDGIAIAVITSDTIFNNDCTLVSDGELFTVSTIAGEIISTDANPDLDGIQITASNQRITFDLKSPLISGTTIVTAQSIKGSSNGRAEIVFYDTIPPSKPLELDAIPENRMVGLFWSHNLEPDIAGYKIYYDTDTLSPFNGIHTVFGEPSPIYSGIADNKMVYGLFNDTTYFFAISALDVSGNESPLSFFVSATPRSISSMLHLTGLTLTSDTDTCFSATQTIITSNITVDSDASVVLVAGENIQLQPLVQIISGSQFKAYIDTTGSYCQQSESIIAAIEAKEDQSAELKFYKEEKNQQFFSLFPNPTPGTFTLQLKKATESVITVEIYTMLGERILQTQLTGQQQYEFDLSSRPGGIYLVRVVRGDEVGVEKLIKQ